jgi:thioredoxin 1
MNNHVVELNQSNFQREVLGAANPVLVQFWAGWSEACKAMTPMLDSVAGDGSVSVKFARVNVDLNEALVERYGVRAVPTLLIFNQGTLQDQVVGRTSEHEIRGKLRRYQ